MPTFIPKYIRKHGEEIEEFPFKGTQTEKNETLLPGGLYVS